MRNLFSLTSVVLVVCTLGPLLGSEVVWAQDERGSSGKETWRFEASNDVFFDSDNSFTNGFNIQKHSALVGGIDELPSLVKLARAVLPQKEGLLYRRGWAVGQNMVTPDDLSDPNIILDDIPYLGMLGFSNSLIAFNDTEFTGFEFLIGVVGEASLADELQTSVHKAIDSEEPLGWDHQLSNELIANFFYMKKRKLWRKPRFDGAVNFDLGVGNFSTFVDVSLEMRFGDMPGGFTYTPDPLGRNMSYDATIDNGDGRYFYGSVIVRAAGFAHATYLDGNLLIDDDDWTENHTIEPKDGIGSVIVGLHYLRPRWGIHFNIWLTSDTHESETIAPNAKDNTNDFSTLMVEWRF
jgi:lipid A 3-O-deacylase